MRLDSIVDDIDQKLSQAPWLRPGGSLLMMVGLPGTGKSSIVDHLQHLLPCTLIATDYVRTEIRRSPTYTASEMMLVYEVCYALIERRLQQGQRVVFDGSNYLAARREYLSNLARRNGAPVAVCTVQASQDVIQQRLNRRHHRGHTAKDKSDADWIVYQWMVEAQEPVVGEHLILDTTNAPPEILAARLRDYWLEVETAAASDPDLQSLGWAGKFSRVHDSRR
ncbi:MAG: ATP-binding protein [Ardenticatenaceae bacterium]|nr:ATP-binding protein [Ardenticatenaceae bacterium]MCB8988580.1 ATP-binding protein [Ardenticatenaceae bacterium]